MRTAGSVTEFDEARGLGTVTTGDGRRLGFHCTAVAGGSRTIDVGTDVRFEIVPGHNGLWEAAGIEPANPDHDSGSTSTPRV